MCTHTHTHTHQGPPSHGRSGYGGLSIDEPGYGGSGRGHAPPPHMGDSRGGPPPRDAYGGAPPTRGGDSYGGSGELSVVSCCHDSGHCVCVVGGGGLFTKLYVSVNQYVCGGSSLFKHCDLLHVVCVSSCLVLENFHFFHVIFVSLRCWVVGRLRSRI